MKGAPATGSRRLLVPLLGLAVGVAAAVALFAYVRNDVQQDAAVRFERQAADAKHIIERRLQSYVGVTYGLKALFDARESVDRSEFRRYVESLDLKHKFPGFEVLSFARHVRADEKARLEESIRRDTLLYPRGFPDFRIKPAGDRQEYHVLVFLEPFEENKFAFGLDINVTPAQMKAQSHARDTGELVSSGRLLNVGKEKAVGIAMRLAVYRKGMPLDTVEARRAAYVGTVGAGYNIRRLMHGVLDETTMTFMRYRLFDAGPVKSASPSPAAPTLLYDSAQSRSGAPLDEFVVPGEGPRLDTELPLQLAGRNWNLRFSAPRAAYIGGSDGLLPWLVLAGGLLTSALLFAVLYAFSSSRARAVVLAGEMTRELRQSEARVRDLLRRLVTAQEAERRRFSADLHDLVGQSLSVLGMGFETIRALMPGALPRKAEATIDDMGRLLKETMGSVRAVMSDLRPPLLDDYGLYAAIEWHARQLQSRTGLHVALEGRELAPRPPADVEMALFRIVQEALTNTAKHAGASIARVAIARSGGLLRLVVEDDGRGIAPAPAANDPGPAGWGMAVMRERAAAIGGTLRVATSGSGTRIVVEVASGDSR